MFDDQCILEDQAHDNHTEPSQPRQHSHSAEGVHEPVPLRGNPYGIKQANSVHLVPGDYTSRGRLYSVIHAGEVLLDQSYNPEFDACRVLLRMGITGKLTTLRDDNPCMILDIEKAAKVTVRDNRYGTPKFVKYREGH